MERCKTLPIFVITNNNNMIQVTLHKERHIIYNEVSSTKSLSSSILLRNHLRSQDVDFINSDWRKKVQFNIDFLKDQLQLHGTLTCVYCQKENLFIHEDFTTEPSKYLLATVDHVIPTGKGGLEYDYSNMVIACWKCNNKKKDKTGYKIDDTHYWF